MNEIRHDSELGRIRFETSIIEAELRNEIELNKLTLEKVYRAHKLAIMVVRGQRTYLEAKHNLQHIESE